MVPSLTPRPLLLLVGWKPVVHCRLKYFLSIHYSIITFLAGLLSECFHLGTACSFTLYHLSPSSSLFHHVGFIFARLHSAVVHLSFAAVTQMDRNGVLQNGSVDLRLLPRCIMGYTGLKWRVILTGLELLPVHYFPDRWCCSPGC